MPGLSTVILLLDTVRSNNKLRMLPLYPTHLIIVLSCVCPMVNKLLVVPARYFIFGEIFVVGLDVFIQN